MNKFFVLEVNYEGGYVYVSEVGEAEYLGSGNIRYSRNLDKSTCLIATKIGPHFYGQLDALLVTQDKVFAAQPIEPEPMVKVCEEAKRHAGWPEGWAARLARICDHKNCRMMNLFHDNADNSCPLGEGGYSKSQHFLEASGA